MTVQVKSIALVLGALILGAVLLVHAGGAAAQTQPQPQVQPQPTQPVAQPPAKAAPANGEALSNEQEESHHEGYYYPKLTSHEVYKARTRVLPQMDRASRLLFIAAMTRDQSAAGWAPRYATFAKGEQAEKMIIVGLEDGWFDTIYRARAVMAALSSLARTTPLLKDANLEDVLTFYDLAHLLGFKEIVVSDGRAFAHRINLVE
jgi:hypothetical protein